MAGWEPTFPHRYLSIPVSPELAEQKHRRGRCVKYRCRRRSARKKGGVCNTCAARLLRLKDPTYYAWSNLRCSARKRGIAFRITLAQWRAWCRETGYVDHRGKTPDAMTVDRREKDKPYTIDNIRPMTHQDNSSHAYEDGEPYEAPW